MHHEHLHQQTILYQSLIGAQTSCHNLSSMPELFFTRQKRLRHILTIQKQNWKINRMNLEEEDEWEDLDEEKGAETISSCPYCDKIFEREIKGYHTQ